MTYACILLRGDLTVRLPHHLSDSDTSPTDEGMEWITFDIKGLTWHQGPTTLSGHYRTLLKEPLILRSCNLVWLVARSVVGDTNQ